MRRGSVTCRALGSGGGEDEGPTKEASPRDDEAEAVREGVVEGGSCRDSVERHRACSVVNRLVAAGATEEEVGMERDALEARTARVIESTMMSVYLERHQRNCHLPLSLSPSNLTLLSASTPLLVIE